MRFVRPRPLATRPRVSVVVPCYNYGHYLGQLAEVLLAQAAVDVDVLIVDDASPDGSGEVAASLADRDSRISVLRHPANAGHIQTYNDGLSRITGDYVVLLSADDLVSSGALARSVALMEAHRSVGFVYGYARSFTGEAPNEETRVRNWTLWPGLGWLRESARQGRCFISSPEVVMRTDALRDVGLYDPRLPHSGDFDLWLRAAARWDVGRVNGPTQALYRVHDNNMHLTTFNGMLTDLTERRKTFDLLFTEHYPDRADVVQLRSRAYRSLANESLRHALAAHRDGGARDLIHEHIKFALETDSSISATLLYRWCEVGPLAGRALPADNARRFIDRARHHLVWRRERRYGT